MTASIMQSVDNRKKISVFEEIDDSSVQGSPDCIIEKFFKDIPIDDPNYQGPKSTQFGAIQFSLNHYDANGLERKLKVSDKIVRPIWHGPGCLGDKYAPRPAQIGTIGQIMKIEDMPYLGDDVPELVVNTQ